MDNAVPILPLAADQDQLLTRIRTVLPLLADISRADAMLCLRTGADPSHASPLDADRLLESPAPSLLRIVAHSRPRSIASVYDHILNGTTLARVESPAVYEAFEQHRASRRLREIPGGGAPVQREVFPLRMPGQPPFGVLVIDTNLLEVERMRRRDRVFQQAVRGLKQMAARGEPDGAAALTAFGQHDGLLFADYTGVIRYMSGIAVNLYRNIGHTETLIGRKLSYLETGDDLLFQEAVQTHACLEREIAERGRQWVKKAIPLQATDAVLWVSRGTHLSGVLIAVHDETEARERERELEIKTTMIKEVHHRVKNDLQTVAALLRMQSRRVQTEEARNALGEAVNRILSIAVIHEFLSEQDTRIINIRDIAGRILNQMQSGVLDPRREIQLRLQGPNIYLTARQATSCALVINELLQNALEHGFDQRELGGTIVLSFQDLGDRVELRIHDDGRGLPVDFDLARVDSLGLRIVRMLVTDDLKGTIALQSDNGVSAIVNFPKTPLGGDEAWNEQE